MTDTWTLPAPSPGTSPCAEGLRHADKTVRACALKVLGLTGHCARPHLDAIAERLRDAEASVQTAALRDCFKQLEAGSIVLSSRRSFCLHPFHFISLSTELGGA